MTSKERIKRTFEHKEADKVPIIDEPWAGTIRRWESQGMPKGSDWTEYFGIDRIARVSVNVSPCYTGKTIEETDRYVIFTTEWGVTVKQLKEEDATPEFIDFKISNASVWNETKKLMTINEERLNLPNLETNYDKWVGRGDWIQALFWFGFDITHSWAIGTETMLIAMAMEPEWITDMFDTYLESNIKHFDMLWDMGYRFDSIFWWDDMGYKGSPFFSNTMYKELLQPFHKRAINWAHNKGIYAHLHSCGFIEPLLPDVVEAGIDALNPIEVKAGMDAIRIKETFGDKIVLHGGIDASRLHLKDEIIPEIEKLVPILKENGGYIFASDHSIPNIVDLETYKAIIDTVKIVGSY